jgi:hypothetical protein
MDGDITVGIPVSAEAAKLLEDLDRARAVGKLVDTMLFPSGPGADLLAPFIAQIKAEARGGGLTDGDIDAELAAYNGENRH